MLGTKPYFKMFYSLIGFAGVWKSQKRFLGDVGGGYRFETVCGLHCGYLLEKYKLLFWGGWGEIDRFGWGWGE